MSDPSLFNEITMELREGIAYERGEPPAQPTRPLLDCAELPAYSPADVKRIRQNVSMTQRNFANFMGVSVKTVEAWENGRNRPGGSAARLLQLVSQNRESAAFRP